MDALRGDEVLVVAGIADQRPAGAEGLAEIVRDRGADEALLARRAARTRSANAGAISSVGEVVPSMSRLFGVELLDGPAARSRASGRRSSATPRTRGPRGRRSRSGRSSAARSSRCSSRLQLRLLVVLLGANRRRPASAGRRRRRRRERSVTVSPPLPWPRMPTEPSPRRATCLFGLPRMTSKKTSRSRGVNAATRVRTRGPICSSGSRVSL